MRIRSYYEGTIDERKRILSGIKKIEDTSHATRTPLFQDTLLALIKDLVLDKEDEVFPPKRFRDISNGE